MLLSKPAIERLMAEGEIVIDPFDPRNLKSAQYDVTLGEHFWRPRTMMDLSVEGADMPLYNPYEEESVRRGWAYEEAKPYVLDETFQREAIYRMGVRKWPERLPGISPNDRIIMLWPGETVLAHTEEFIGSASNRVTAMMKARSSMGRNFLEVCRCAGMGDHGYCNRWTLEIQNNSKDFAIPIVAGRRVGQLLFFETEPLANYQETYTSDGKYQKSAVLSYGQRYPIAELLSKLKESWTPDDMLPKQWEDREAKEVSRG